MTIDQLVIYREKIRSVSVPEAVHYLLGEIDRFMDENTRLTAELDSFRKSYEDVWNRAEQAEKERDEAQSECNLWKAENSNAQTSIGIHLDRIISLEKEKYEAIRMAQAAVTCSKDWQNRAEEWEIEYAKVNTVRNEQDAIISKYREALEKIAERQDLTHWDRVDIAQEALK